MDRQRLEIGGWNPLDYDDEIVVNGLRWLRVAGGFGGKNDRTDWVADSPGICVSVSRWHTKRVAQVEDNFGYGFDGNMTRDEAMRQAIEDAIGASNFNIARAMNKLATITEGRERLIDAREAGHGNA